MSDGKIMEKFAPFSCHHLLPDLVTGQLSQDRSWNILGVEECQIVLGKKETVSFDQAFGPGEKKTVGEGGVFTSDFIKELPNFTVVSIKTGL